MNTVITHKGYTGHAEIDLDAGLLFGRVLDITDVIPFQGTTVTEAQQAFAESVDDYLAYCEELGQEPERPFSGKLLFRTTPERHHPIFVATTLLGKSINTWIDEVLAETAENTIHQYDKVTATLASLSLQAEAIRRR